MSYLARYEVDVPLTPETREYCCLQHRGYTRLYGAVVRVYHRVFTASYQTLAEWTHLKCQE